MTLWQEFLSGYFNGGNHVLHAGANQRVFPLVPLGFNQTTLPQAMEGGHINVIVADPGKLIERNIAGRYAAFQNVMMEFHVRAAVKEPKATGKNDEYICREIADCLYGLLADRGASIVLQNKGMRYLRPWAPKPIPNTFHRLRIVRCSVQYNFSVAASFATTSDLGGD